MARTTRTELRLRREAAIRRRWNRRTFVATATVGLLLLGSAALADLIHNDVDESIDSEIETVVMAPGDVETVEITWINTNNNAAWGPGGSNHDDPDASYVDTENACNLRGGRIAKVSVANTSPGVAAVTGADLEDGVITFDDCGQSRVLTITAVASGTTEVRFAIADGTTADGSNFTAPANFDVQVVDPDPGRDAPAIANEYLRTHTDGDFLAACKAAQGTNKNKSNWHGQLISQVANQFDGPQQVSPVVAYVNSLCGS